MLNIIIAVTAGYLIVMPILFRLAAFLHKKLLIEKRAQKIKGNNAQALKSLPKPLWPKWQELLKFALKDKRDLVLGKPKKGKGGEPTSSKMTNKQAFFLFHLISLAISIVGAVVGIWWVILIGYLGFFMTLQWAMKTAKPIIETRRKVLDRMFSIGQSKLGLSMEHKDNPQAVIEVLEWNDYVKPQKVRYQVPDNFGAEGEEGFLRQFNQLFGAETAWVPSPDMEADPPTPGWDYQSGQATFHAVPPLPTMAPWSERYVLSPGIHWAFFPLALGVENGVELMNEESGELEYVLGFDLSGEQAKEGKKNGLKVSPTITTSPMVFIGGGTGGGKSLSADTLVEVLSFANPDSQVETIPYSETN